MREHATTTELTEEPQTQRDTAPRRDKTDQLLSLQRGAGNAAVTRMVQSTRGPVLARTLSGEVGSVEPGDVSAASVHRLWARLSVALADLRDDDDQAAYADLDLVDVYISKINNGLSLLDGYVASTQGVDQQTGVPAAAVNQNADDLPGALYHALVALGGLRDFINSAFYGWEGAQFVQQAAATTKRGRQERADADAATATARRARPEEPAAEERVIEFGHKNKHRPTPEMVKDLENLRRGTAGAGTPAKYRTMDPATVRGWERQAVENGLLFADGATIIHRFGETIGADTGELTQYIRIDGDHGHPITEDGGLKTGFFHYVKSEIDLAKNSPARLKFISDYLTRVGLSPVNFKGLKNVPR